jgi:hypothetical protein
MSASTYSWPRRLVALLGLVVLLVSTPAAAVLESRQPLSRGDVMRLIFTAHVPDEIEPVARVVQHNPGQIDLAGTPRAPAEPRNAVVGSGQAKGVVPGPRGSRWRIGRRRRRVKPPTS